MTTYSTDPALWIFTSLTAGSSHIVTATSRLETILRANRVPFKAVDLATDSKARMFWGRRAGKDESGRVRKLPGLVQNGEVLGIEDWNEYGELKKHVKIYYDEHTIPDIHHKHPPSKLRRPVQKGTAAAATGAAKSAAAAASPAAASSSSSAGTPAPANPPPAPEPKKTAPVTTTANKDGAKGAEKKKEETKEALPIRSVADEAAKKAKELRLKSLREKVHGKKTDDGEKKEEPKKDDTEDKAKTEKVEKENEEVKPDKKEQAAARTSTPGLQSPTSDPDMNET
ncbi:hypothetical protein ACRE_038860 [Hapsidospora chrysogenum ATCC 11550]|uniref:Thioredoxin-like protein n=1 Tax=Hapsidospora chrysogenum (strain ATCC 11550 / CBS 779.69 / DSM 880 / IAM 14645 / JCM 23072 / IMI 49137) TaxID=857340 RepID=A0A086T7F8_HAPC1|nr:hypothetical protein ACRE_038860 [Hapsidospora chrysogenum ATCC 11550]